MKHIVILTGILTGIAVLAGCGGGGGGYKSRELTIGIGWTANADLDLIVTRRGQTATSPDRSDYRDLPLWANHSGDNIASGSGAWIEVVSIPQSQKDDEPYVAYVQNFASFNVSAVVAGFIDRNQNAPYEDSFQAPARSTVRIAYLRSSGIGRAAEFSRNTSLFTMKPTEPADVSVSPAESPEMEHALTMLRQRILRH